LILKKNQDKNHKDNGMFGDEVRVLSRVRKEEGNNNDK